MEFRCKCHGMSGSCQLKTCWKSAPDFHVVGKVLKHQFRKAILVDQSNLGNGEPVVVLKRARNKKSNGGSGSGSASSDLDTADASGSHDGGGTGDSEGRRMRNSEWSGPRGSRVPIKMRQEWPASWRPRCSTISARRIFVSGIWELIYRVSDQKNYL